VPRTAAHDDNVDRFTSWIEENLHLAAVQLTYHLRHLDLERDVALAIFGSFPQNEGLHDGAKHVGGQLLMGHLHRRWSFRPVFNVTQATHRRSIRPTTRFASESLAGFNVAD
jgi:hypothetical protein